MRHGQDDRARDDGTPLTRQGAWLRVRYAAKRAKVLPPGVYIEFVEREVGWEAGIRTRRQACF